MTWAVIRKRNELNAINVAYCKQKSKIFREFEGIKKEVRKKIWVKISFGYEFMSCSKIIFY